MKAAIFLEASASSSAAEIVERDFDTPGQQRAEAVAEDLVADQRQRAVGQAVESVAAINDAVATCCRTGKLDGGLDRFGPRIGKEHLFEMGHVAQQALGQDTGKGRHIHLDEVWKVAGEDFPQSVVHDRMVASESEYTPPAQQVEVLKALAIV